MGDDGPRTEWVEKVCRHCRERHEVQKVVEPGWEQVEYCPRTGDAG